MANAVLNVQLPKLHPGQEAVVLKRFTVLVCGRRWGKTEFLCWHIIHALLKGQKVGMWLPKHKFAKTIWSKIKQILPAQLITKQDQGMHILEMLNGATFNIYTTGKDPDGGRGEKFHLAIIDEAGEIKKFRELWEATIYNTLIDYSGTAIIAGTPKGRNYFFTLFNQHLAHPEEWSSYTARTMDNPYLPKKELVKIQKALEDNPDNPYIRQENLAEFIENGSCVFNDLKRIQFPQPNTHVRIGIDLASTTDYTVITAFNQAGQQVLLERFNKMDWDAITNKLKTIIDSFGPIGKTINIDSTGVGRPICDRLSNMGYKINPVFFTSTKRTEMLENLSLLIGMGEVEFIDDKNQDAEFESFVRRLEGDKIKLVSDITDDVVMACALALRDKARAPLQVFTT